MCHRLPVMILIPLVVLLLVPFAYAHNPFCQQLFFSPDTSYPSFVKALGYHANNVVDSNDLTRLSSGFDNVSYQEDTIGRHCYLYLQAEIKRASAIPVKKFPLNISIVIDASGSMKGEKMDHAIEAACHMVDQVSSNDMVSIVIYGDDVEVIQPSIYASNKNMIKEKIKQIRPRGGTNLWGGCETGYYQVMNHAKPGYINHVFLVSDGLANVGITSSKNIKGNVQRYKDDEGITLSCFGVGLDFNEVLLSEMAEIGSGHYYFIEDPVNITGMMEVELKSLLPVAARDVMLTLDLPLGVKPDKMTSFLYTVNGQVVTIRLRDMHEGERKQVLLDLKIADTVRHPLPFRVQLSYNDAVSGQAKKLVNRHLLKPAGAKEYFGLYNREVINKVLLYAAGDNMEAAMSEVDKNNFEMAANIMTQNKHLLNHHRSYINQSGSLQQMEAIADQYKTDMLRMRSMSRDSIRWIQKTQRSALYEARIGY